MGHSYLPNYLRVTTVDLPLYNKGSYATKALVAARFSLWLFKPVIDRGVRPYDG